MKQARRGRSLGPAVPSSFLEGAQASLDEDVYGAANAWPVIPLREFGAGDRVASAHLEEPDGTHDHRVDASRCRIRLRVGILPGKHERYGKKRASRTTPASFFSERTRSQ